MITSSLIIPTLNRAGDLTRCLTSVAQLTQKFDQIIVVEQGDLQTTQRIINTFAELDIELYFLPVKSLAQARNFGIEKATGDLIFFTDDDTELDQHYTRVAHAYFADHPQVMGLTGKVWEMPIRSRTYYWIHRLLGALLLVTPFRPVISKSGGYAQSFFHHRVCNTQFLPGNHMVFRAAVFKHGFYFNPNFIRWSFGEDAMLSHQIYKYYGKGSLRYLPAFTLIHHNSSEQSLTNHCVIRMKIIYRFIFWHQEAYQGKLFNLVCYLYGQLGFMIYLLRHHKNRFSTTKVAKKTYAFLLKNRHKITTNKIDYNHFILHDR